MSEPSPSPASSPADRSARALGAFEVALILAVFYLSAGWPPPEVNEPHYLAKARHYWDPAWGPKDFFLGTADAHQVFYWTFGWLTLWMPLGAVAWVGRLITWTLLAWSWRRLSVAIAPGPLSAVLSAALFVAGSSHAQLAGEWVVGGLEAKGVAYALVFFALGQIIRGRWTGAWLLLGGATAFHPLVGGWSAIAAGVVWLAAGDERPPLRHTIPAWLGMALLAAPGVLPALALTRGVDAATVAEANQIYVERLEHHLAFHTFAVDARIRFAALAIAWAIVAALAPRGSAERRLRWFVGASLAIAAGGVAIDLGLGRHERLSDALLRYYWFRLADAMVPAGAALGAVAVLTALLARRTVAGPAWLLALLLAAGAHLGDVLYLRLVELEYPSPPADWSTEDPDAWREICRWARENTPPDAVFLVPRTSETFRWWTDRAEVVSRKDIPQDARGIIAWRERMVDLYWRPAAGNEPAGWRGSLASLGAERLAELGAKYDADYVVTSAYPPLRLRRVSPPNAAYAVYKLPRSAGR